MLIPVKKTYRPILLRERHFYEKMYLLPIERAEILKTNGKLTQTEGWENG